MGGQEVSASGMTGIQSHLVKSLRYGQQIILDLEVIQSTQGQCKEDAMHSLGFILKPPVTALDRFE